MRRGRTGGEGGEARERAFQTRLIYRLLLLCATGALNISLLYLRRGLAKALVAERRGPRGARSAAELDAKLRVRRAQSSSLLSTSSSSFALISSRSLPSPRLLLFTHDPLARSLSSTATPPPSCKLSPGRKHAMVLGASPFAAELLSTH